MALSKNSSYNLTTGSDYLRRQMFLDDAGPVTIQRFEEVRYPTIQKYEETARGFFWIPEEITLTKDKIDFQEASEAVRHIFTSNILRQTALDSIQGRAPAQIFVPVVSLPELESLVMNWSFFEGNIHSKSYSHIIRNVYGVPRDEFNRIHDIKPIVNMAASIGAHYDYLHLLNCRKQVGEPVSRYEHKRAIWMALHASYALEAIRFMVSFATSLGMVENKLFVGNGSIISLILQDELLHTEFTGWILNQLIKDDPDFAKLKIECAAAVYTLYMDAIREEKEWADYLFSKGVVIGLNAEIMKSFVDWTAYQKLKDIGIKYEADRPKSHPIPWFNKHVNTHKKQTALQESESTSYVIGVLTSEINYAELPDL